MAPARSRRLRRASLGLLGVIVALGAAELVFRTRDEQAFPHLRCYQADPELGVRLEPNRIERIRFGGAPPTTVRIGPEGLRGAALPPPSAKRDEILVVGDSQAFGLGVEDDQTFSAALQRSLGKTVIDAGVPTYGPPEYEAMIQRWTTQRPIGVVVLALTFQNDFFEAERPNKDRHETWDGWAVRKGTAPARVTPFPGRSWLYRDSHLFYAFRRTLHESTSAEDATPGDGNVSTDTRVATVADFAKAGAIAEARLQEKRAAEVSLSSALAAPQPSAVTAAPSEMVSSLALYDEYDLPKMSAVLLATANPGDIVDTAPGGEVAPISLRATAATIAEGARLRQQLEATWRKKHEAEIAKAETSTRELRAQRAAFTFATSPLAARLQRIAKELRAKGIGLVVLGIPMDVMLFDDAWKKYGAEAHPDVAPIRGLADELDAALGEEHVPWVFPFEALQGGGADVFMPLEFHLTAKGHGLVAQQLEPWIKRAASPLPAPDTKPASSVYCARCQETETRFAIDVGGVLHARGVVPEGKPDHPGVGYGVDESVLDFSAGEKLDLVGATELERFTVLREPERWLVTATRLPRFDEEPKWQAPVRKKQPSDEFMRVTGLALEPRYVGRTCETTYLVGLPPYPKGVFPGWQAVARWENESKAWLKSHADAVSKYRACQVGADDPPCAAGQIATGPSHVCRALCSTELACAAGESCVAYAGQRVCRKDATDPSWLPPAAPPPSRTMGRGESDF